MIVKKAGAVLEDDVNFEVEIFILYCTIYALNRNNKCRIIIKPIKPTVMKTKWIHLSVVQCPCKATIHNGHQDNRTSVASRVGKGKNCFL